MIQVKIHTVLDPTVDASPLLMQMSVPYFIRMVVQACLTLGAYVRPSSPTYVEPVQYVQDDALEVNELQLRCQFPGMKMGSDKLTREHWTNAWQGLDLIHEYVALVNQHKGWFVGEEGWTRELVYRTLCTAHNWTVKQIEDTHRMSGKNHGSATRDQQESVAKGVLTWPDRFGFTKLNLLVLPKDRPGYYSKLQVEVGKRYRCRNNQIVKIGLSRDGVMYDTTQGQGGREYDISGHYINHDGDPSSTLVKQFDIDDELPEPSTAT